MRGDSEVEGGDWPTPSDPGVLRGSTLLVVAPSGMTTVSLPSQGRVFVGRATECEVQIDDPKLSRRHARIDVGERVTYTDLGSLNGSFSREERLEPNVPLVVGSGDAVTLGGTVIVLQKASRRPRPRHVWTHGYFEARLEEECERAASGGAAFAVARLQLAVDAALSRTQQDSTAVATAASAMASWLRPADIVAKYAPNEWEFLLTMTAAADAEKRMATLRAQLDGAGLKFALGLAIYPRDGRTPEALVERAAAPLQHRDPASPSATVATGALERMERVVQRVATGDISVLILGETGVGKEVLARRIHDRSPRAKSPLVSMNCAALTESLLESELFGHEKGAFTGAVQAKIGLLESANGGTVFLDEVGEMPLSVQAKLLRVLEQREVVRVGSVKPRPIDVRILAATNRDLESEVESGRFRQDVYFRLNGITIYIPPLRERVDEIEPLARVFIDQACRRMGRDCNIRLGSEALTILVRYEWPGNIRELKNVIERAVILCSGSVIMPEHLPAEKMGGSLLVAPRSAEAPAPRSALVPASSDGAATTHGTSSVSLRVRIARALEECGGNQTHAAKLLGISRGTLVKRIAEYGFVRPRKRNP
jgi:two-component system, NtrC family, response regulator AtoC